MIRRNHTGTAGLALAALLALPGCFGGDGTTEAVSQAFAFFERQGDWVISCPRGSAAGTIDECRLGRMSGPADRQGIDNTLLVRATAAGVQIDDPSSQYAGDCGVTPSEHRVDETTLAGLGGDQRIALLSSGRLYYRETLARPPDCRLSVGRTDLTGFGPAYARFLEVSQGFGLAGAAT